MQLYKVDDGLQQAISETHTGYFSCGEIIQDLIWEQYTYPVELQKLLAGNSDLMVSRANSVTTLDPPIILKDDILINKTGSTNGFAAYVLFVPSKKIGMVMLANKNYPIPSRVAAAYQILNQINRDFVN